MAKRAARQGGLRPLALRAALIPLLTVPPLQLWAAHDLYAPWAEIDARLNAARADFVMIGTEKGALWLDGLVFNRADLSNRPLRLLANRLDDGLIATLCAKGATAALPKESFYRPLDRSFWVRPDATARILTSKLAGRFETAGCKVAWLDES